ncbi:MAG: hypothetical protein AAGD01_12885 [Acidobacteriota bacterium]
MDFDTFLRSVERPLAAMEELDGSVAAAVAAGPWSLRLSDLSTALPDLLPQRAIFGDLALSGEADIALHLTPADGLPRVAANALVGLETDAEPSTLLLATSSPPGVPLAASNPSSSAPTHFASLVAHATLGANADGAVPSARVPTGVGIQGGLQGGTIVAAGHHLAVSPQEPAGAALRRLLGRLAGVWQGRRIAALGQSSDSSAAGATAIRARAETEVVDSLLTGQLELEISARYDLLHFEELAGSTLDRLRLQRSATLVTDAQAQVRLGATLEGSYRLRATPSPRGPGIVRLSIHRHRHRFVGADLLLSLGVSVQGASALVDEALGKVLELPDQLVASLRSLLQEIRLLEAQIQELEDDLRVIFGMSTAADSLGVLSLEDLVQGLQRVAGSDSPQDVALTQLRLLAQRQLSRTRLHSKTLRSIAGATLDPVSESLAVLRDQLEDWLRHYDRLRRRGVDFLSRHAETGARISLQSTINRTSTRHALLTLDFDLERAEGHYFDACRGALSGVLEAAKSSEASGVWLLGGVLEKALRDERSSRLDLSLFGFPIHRQLASWSSITTREDLVSGQLLLASEAGAQLLASSPRQTRSLQFLFQLTQGATTGNELSIASSLELETEVPAGRARAEGLENLVEDHLRGARRLGALPPDELGPLRQRLLAGDEEAAYSYRLRLRIDPRGLDRVFQLRAEARRARSRLWEELRAAVSTLNLNIPVLADEPYPLSRLLTDAAVAWLEEHPSGLDWSRFRIAEVAPEGRFPSGADRLAWAYLFDLHRFVLAYGEARAALRQAREQGGLTRDLSRELRQMATQVIRPPGAFAVQPVDAKYLALALLAGSASEITALTFRRGDLELAF